MPTARPGDLQWDAKYLATLMRRRKIHDRTDLSRMIDVPYTTVVRYLEADWTGPLHIPLLAALATYFNVHAGRLIADTRYPNPRHD